jgi:hypothetical protein
MKDSVILNNSFNFIVLQNLIEFNKVFLRFNCRILRSFKGMKNKWSRSIQEASLKIYDHIHCIGIIQNLIFFIIMQGRDYVAENRYNDSPIVITIQYISQNFLSSMCVEISQKLT